MSTPENETPGFAGDERFGGDADKLYASYRELEKKLGSALPAPTSDDGLEALFKRLGAPDSPDGYETPAGVDPTLADELRSFAAGARLTPAQFAKMAESMQSTRAAEFAAKTEATTNAQSAVEAEYGAAFPEAAARAKAAFEALPEDQRATVDPTDPATFRLLEKLGAKVGPAGVAPLSAAAPASFDPEAVAEEGRKIMASAAFGDRFHPEHQIAKDEYAKRIMQLLEKGYEGVYDPRLTKRRSPW
jgi:hypothetical protein